MRNAHKSDEQALKYMYYYFYVLDIDKLYTTLVQKCFFLQQLDTSKKTLGSAELLLDIVITTLLNSLC